MGKSPLCVEVNIMHLDRDGTISSDITRRILVTRSPKYTFCAIFHQKLYFWFYLVLLLLFVGDVYLMFWQNHWYHWQLASCIPMYKQGSCRQIWYHRTHSQALLTCMLEKLDKTCVWLGLYQWLCEQLFVQSFVFLIYCLRLPFESGVDSTLHFQMCGCFHGQ